jgi:hypothetical protein
MVTECLQVASAGPASTVVTTPPGNAKADSVPTTSAPPTLLLVVTMRVGSQHANVVVVVELVVVVVVLVVVATVVVVVSGMPSHGGSVGSVQEQFGFVLHSFTTVLLQALKAMPVKAPHTELISSEQTFGLHFPAALASETKTPAPSTTAANVTTAPLIIVIVKPLWQLVAQHQLVGGTARRSDGEGAD